MMIKCEENIEEYIEEMKLNVVNKTPDGYQIKVTGEDEAKKFLNKLVANDITIIRYELREPSLHEIFVEKVGETHEEQ